eukprot:g7190.t1
MLSQKVTKLEQDVQNVNDRFQREISQLFGKVMETEIPKIMDKAVVHSASEASPQEVVDKYLSSLATKLQTVVDPVFEDIVRKSLQTAINTAVEDAVKRQHQEEIEAQRQLLRKEGYEKAVAENSIIHMCGHRLRQQSCCYTSNSLVKPAQDCQEFRSWFLCLGRLIAILLTSKMRYGINTALINHLSDVLYPTQTQTVGGTLCHGHADSKFELWWHHHGFSVVTKPPDCASDYTYPTAFSMSKTLH